MPIDYLKYPDNWKSEIRPKVLKRARNKCEVCGIENHSYVHSFKENGKTVWRWLGLDEWFLKGCPKQVRVILTVAHLDHDETNGDVSLDRLMAMCQLCHLRYDVEEKQKRKKVCIEFQR